MTLTTSDGCPTPSNVLEALPARVRGGRPFEPVEEKELNQPLRVLASRLPGGKQGVYVVPEFFGSSGVADLVAVTRADADLQDRIASGLPFLSSLTLATVAAAIPSGRHSSIERVSAVLHMTTRQLLVYVRELESGGVVVKEGSGYRRHKAMRPVGRMYAFEAKVSDWNRALAQAVRYSSWADAASIVLLRTPGDVATVAKHARAMNVGLAVGTSWMVRPRIAPPASPAHAGGRLFASEQFVRSVAGHVLK